MPRAVEGGSSGGVSTQVQQRKKLRKINKNYVPPAKGKASRRFKQAMSDARKSSAMQRAISKRRASLSSGRPNAAQRHENFVNRLQHMRQVGNKAGVERMLDRRKAYRSKQRHEGESVQTPGTKPPVGELRRVMREGRRQKQGTSVRNPGETPPINPRPVPKPRTVPTPRLKKLGRYETPPTRPVTRY